MFGAKSDVNYFNISGASNKSLTANVKIKKSSVDIISEGTRLIWNKKVFGTKMEKLQNIIQAKYNVKFESYWDFHEWSVQNYPKFWEEVWNFYEVICSKPYDQPFKRIGDGFMDVEWFPGAELNFAENVFRYRDDGVALICVGEDGNELKVTYAQMYEEVRIFAAAFKKNGLKKGDRVAGYMSNRREAIYAMLAAASMGALFGGPLPFYESKGAKVILDIMKPKFLLTVDRFQYRQKEFNILDRLPEIVNGLKCIEKVIIIPTKENSKFKDISLVNNSCFLDEFLAGGLNQDGRIPDLVFEQFPLNQPLLITFTSGTTGTPKGIVHAAGVLLPLLRDFSLHNNLDRSDISLIMQPVGWILWNLLFGNLLIGSTILLYDGIPISTKSSFWDLLDKYKVTYALIATSNIEVFEKEGIVPGPNCKLEHLKLITVGCSPVKPQNVEFILQKVKPDVFVGCLYGTTEVIGEFTGFDYNTPNYSAEMQCPALGVNIEIFDEEGNSVIGKPGELVITTHYPAFPICVLNDENGLIMQETYLSKFPNVWVPSDEAWIDPKTRGLFVIGRSDNTIKQYGERFASEEIYWSLHDIEEIADCICVAQNNSTEDDRAVLFVKMKNALVLDKDMISKIKENILKVHTVLHIPKVILQVEDLPYNLNGKKMESLVKKIINTNQIPEVNNIRNPECLKNFINIPEILNFQVVEI